jgi:hypothetical protein
MSCQQYQQQQQQQEKEEEWSDTKILYIFNRDVPIKVTVNNAREKLCLWKLI